MSRQVVDAGTTPAAGAGQLRHPGTRLLSWLHDPPGHPPQPGPQLRWRQVLPVALVGLVGAVLLVGFRIGLPGEVDPVEPFVVGTQWETARALDGYGVSITSGPSSIGYDGQWFLGQAHDPLLRGDVVTTFDHPRYRALRMLYPVAGWLLAAGRPAAIPFGLLAAAALAVALGCAACARIGSGFGRSRWWGLLFAAIPGVMVGAAFGTAEPLGLALVALGLSLTLDRRFGWAGLGFAGAALTKETYLAFAGAAAVYIAVGAVLHGSRRWWRPAGWLVVPGVVALAGWWGYVAVAVPQESGPRSLGVFAPPLVGWTEVLVMITRGDYPSNPIGWAGAAVVVATFGLLVAALVQAVRRRGSLLSYGVLVWGSYGMIMSGLLLSRFLSAQRALAPAVLAALLLAVAAGWFTPRARWRPAPDRLPPAPDE